MNNTQAIFKTLFWLNLSIFVACITSILMIHNNMIVLYIIIIIYIILYLKKRMLIISSSTWFILIYVGLFMLNPLIFSLLNKPFEDKFGVFGQETLFIYNMFVILGINIFFIGREIAFSSLSKDILNLPKKVIWVSSSRIQLIIYILIFFHLISLSLIFWEHGSLTNLMTFSRSNILSSSGLTSLVVQYLLYASLPLYFLLPLHIKRKPIQSFFLIILLFLVSFEVFMAFRVRGFFVAQMIAFISGWFYSKQIIIYPHALKSNNRKSIKIPSTRYRCIIVALFMTIILASGITIRFVRGYIGVDTPFVITEVDIKNYIVKSVYLGDLGYTPIVMRLVETVPKEQDFLYGQSYWRLFLTPLPRALFTLKPYNTQRVVAQWLYPEIEEYTLPPGIIGDLYINFGFFGIIGMLFYGYVFGKLDSIQGIKSILIAGCLFTPIFHLVRGGFTNPIMIASIIFLSCNVVGRFISPININAIRR